MFTDQSPFTVRFEWGERGLEAVIDGCRVVVLVDVFSFCTAVDVATSRGATILPWATHDGSAARWAAERGALLASDLRTVGGLSLSPASLTTIEPGVRLVLPSQNGATLSRRVAGRARTFAACLRNARAVARRISEIGGPVAVVACGERWPDGTLRPAWEDLVGAGLVIAGLPGSRSPEAHAACDAFRAAESELSHRLRICSSGRELIERNFEADVELAADCHVSRCTPELRDGEYVDATDHWSGESDH